ncbi:MAG TPA: galactose-1-epimerase, partial [Clostridiales bacterium]|nr:galactose-1-epimerase [Clostridiales bacterium]
MLQISEQKYGDIYVITLQNDDLILKTTNFGCNIISLYTKDKNNIFGDIVLGFDSIDDYKNQDKYIGAIVGRCANRISNATFSLNDKEYKLAKNNGPNHLHGGINGFDKKIFKYKILDNGVEFFYLSKSGEEGYPGNLKLKVSYILNENSI